MTTVNMTNDNNDTLRLINTFGYLFVFFDLKKLLQNFLSDCDRRCGLVTIPAKQNNVSHLGISPRMAFQGSVSGRPRANQN